MDASELPAGFETAALELAQRFAGVECSEPGGRAERDAGEPLRAAAAGGARRRELPPELVDEAMGRARVRTAVGRLPDGGVLSDEVIDELLAGARTEEESPGPMGCWRS